MKPKWAVRRDEQRAKQKRHSRAHRKWWLQHSYGLSLADYFDLRAKQNGGCAACGRKPEDDLGLHVDHNHQTGKVRGLLCSGCNTALGLLREDTKAIRGLLEYIKATN